MATTEQIHPDEVVAKCCGSLLDDDALICPTCGDWVRQHLSAPLPD